MKHSKKWLAAILALVLLIGILPLNALAANPYLPLWERVPDGEPRVFEDPDNPGQYRLYVYGSHDIRVSGYCGPDHVVWSAPVDDLNNWRYEGVAFHVDMLNGIDYVDSDGQTKQLVVDVDAIEGFTDELGAAHRGSTGKNIRVQLYAPDVVYHPENNKYYMYLFVDGMWHVNPNSTGTPPQRRHPMFVAESDSPCGPFTNPRFVTLAFDPAVLVDDVKNEDGKSRVYLYWTPEENRSLMACELDPDDMCTILPGTMHYPLGDTEQAPANTLPDWTAPFHMFEGASIRKVNGFYMLNYCRGERTARTATNNISEIGWAYSESPFGPWTYGGVVVSNKGEVVTNPYTGESAFTFNGGNIHGGMCEVNGQWYQIYHRNSNVNGKRQSMAEAIDLHFEDGKPVIVQSEMTSQGFETDGLDPYKSQYASYACYTLPDNGPQFFSQVDAEAVYTPDAERDNWYPAQKIRHQNWLGYKYFNFGGGIPAEAKLRLDLTMKSLAAGTTINLYASDAKLLATDPEQPKEWIGSVTLNDTNGEIQTVSATIEKAEALVGKKGIYLEFLNETAGNNTNLVELNTLQFVLEYPPFEDISRKAFYYDAVEWAAANGITNGTTETTFSPDDSCTRAQVVSFLWRAAGEPEPKSLATQFKDVRDDAWYAKAVAWAVENGITNGMGNARFCPDDICDRAQIVTFLWRAAGKPEPESTSAGFVDVSDNTWYTKAVAWAVENDITRGTDKNVFSPAKSCTRAQVITFLYRSEA